jgi:hypothetical protein
MPFRDLPAPYPTRLRVTLAACWAALVSGGVGAFFFTPRTIEGTIGSTLTYTWASLVLVGAVAALLGVAFNRYRIEWVATWFVSSGLVAYVGTVWWLVGAETLTRWTQASMVTALLGFVMFRAEELAAHAAKLRATHPGVE